MHDHPCDQNGTPLEIERKYLIRYPNTDYLLRLPGCRKLEMEQIYLISPGGERLRIRKVNEKGILSFFRTMKRDVTNVTRIELEDRITEADYLRLRADADPARHPIRKTRYCLPWMNQLLEIDVYSFWQDRATLEVELGSEDESIQFPPFLELIREVTDEPAYRNSSLALLSDPHMPL